MPLQLAKNLMSYLVAKGLPHTVLYLVLLYYQGVGQEVAAKIYKLPKSCMCI